MKLLTTFLLFFILLFMSACGTKIPFKEQEVVADASLVYIYAPMSFSADDTIDNGDYSVYINNKRYEQDIKLGEYIPLNLKPKNTKLSVRAIDIEELSITLDLKPANTYYLKISGSDTFSFKAVEENIALKEIRKTVLAGAFEKSVSETITELVGSDDDNKSVENKKTTESSKLQELQDAAKLKEQGLLTDEEFKALKSDILK